MTSPLEKSSYGGPENSRVYVGAPLTLTAKIDPVIEWNEDISIEWKVFVYDENGEARISIRNL